MRKMIGYAVGVPIGDTYQMHPRVRSVMTRTQAEGLLASLRDENWDDDAEVVGVYLKEA